VKPPAAAAVEIRCARFARLLARMSDGLAPPEPPRRKPGTQAGWRVLAGRRERSSRHRLRPGFVTEMQIYLINLDRHPRRLQRMENLLPGLPFKRIAAVDGRTVAGPEQRDDSRPLSAGNLSRYDKACTLSHRVAWQEFLAGDERWACILEDDILISPDFPRFIRDESWIPGNCDLMKIETNHHKIFVTRARRKCLDRTASVLLSLHFGTAAYLVSRKGAVALLERTIVLDRTPDRLVFDEDALRRHHPVYQLFPALCIQGARFPNGIEFPEMQSAIQPAVAGKRKTVLTKTKAELARPFYQLADRLRTLAREKRLRARRCVVPFA
jgi:glycosyl transferase family 25